MAVLVAKADPLAGLAATADRTANAPEEFAFYYADLKAARRVSATLLPGASEQQIVLAALTRITLANWRLQELRNFALYNPDFEAAFEASVGFSFMDVETIGGVSRIYERVEDEAVLLHLGDHPPDETAIRIALERRGFAKRSIADPVWNVYEEAENPGALIRRAPAPLAVAPDQPVHLAVDGQHIIVAGTRPGIEAALSQPPARMPADRSAFLAAAQAGLIPGELVQFIVLPPLLEPEQLADVIWPQGHDEAMRAELLDEIDRAPRLPRFDAVALFDAQDGETAVVSLGLIYASEETASLAAKRLADRISTIWSFAGGKRMAEVLNFARRTKITQLHDGRFLLIESFSEHLDTEDSGVRSLSKIGPVQLLRDTWLVEEFSNLLAWGP